MYGLRTVDGFSYLVPTEFIDKFDDDVLTNDNNHNGECYYDYFDGEYPEYNQFMVDDSVARTYQGNN